MAEGPAISVVMGVYNGGSNLDESIESVLQQTFTEFEFLIVDDGSTDPLVASILARWAQADARVRPLTKRNEGLTRALLDACAVARGDYIARIDVGDTMAQGRLEAQKSVLDTYPGCHLVTSAVSFHGPAWESMWVNKGRPTGTEPVCVLGKACDTGLDADIPHHGSVMFRRSAYEAVGGYRPEFYYGQDWDLWYRLAETGDFLVLPQVLYNARFFRTQSV